MLIPGFVVVYDDYILQIYSTWLFIEFHSEHRAHGLDSCWLRLISDLAAIFIQYSSVLLFMHEHVSMFFDCKVYNEWLASYEKLLK